jgi:hypothetical protein
MATAVPLAVFLAPFPAPLAALPAAFNFR